MLKSFFNSSRLAFFGAAAFVLVAIPLVLVSSASGSLNFAMWHPSNGAPGFACSGADLCAEWCEYSSTEGWVGTNCYACIGEGSMYTDDFYNMTCLRSGVQ